MRISIASPDIGEEEISAVNEVLKSKMLAAGPVTAAFEKEFAKFVGSRFASAVNSGTSALSLSLLAAGVGFGDEVITTPFTFVATANAILSCGATPIFADIDEETYNLSPTAVKSKITEKTKAIIPVHLYGLPAKMTEFRKIGYGNGLVIIGDAAQAHGAKINNENVGTLADLECFSFYPTKNMTTGEGGMITTNDEGLYQLVTSIRNHGRPGTTLGTYEHERFGLNYRLTDIGSAIGRVQLTKLPHLNEIRARNAEYLTQGLSELERIILPGTFDGLTHAWHQYTIRVSDRHGLAAQLREDGIGTGIYYPRLIFDYPHLEAFKTDCPVAESLVGEVLSLPIHAGLSFNEIDEIIEHVSLWCGK